jgi:hypothetical protein
MACHNELLPQEILKARHSQSLQREIFQGSSQRATATRDFERLDTVSHCNERFFMAGHNEPLPQEIFKGSSQSVTDTRDLLQLVTMSHCHKRI